MDLVDLRCFVAVAEELHFGRAASKLVYTTSHVSQRVAKLESELGVSLFVRSTRQVRLTEAGEAILERTRTALDAIGEVEAEARRRRHADDPELVVAYSPSAGAATMQIVARLRADAALTTVRLDPRPSSPDTVRAVMQGTAAVGVAQWTNDALACLVVRRPLAAILVAAGHRLAHRAEVTPRDLDGERFIIAERSINPEMYDAYVGYFAALGVAPRLDPRHITGGSQIVELIAAGQGISFGAQGPDGPYGDLPVVSIAFTGPPPPGNTVYAMWPRESSDERVTAFVDAARRVAESDR